MMEAVAAGDLDAIVAFAADRLTRKPRENEDFIDYAERHGLELATVTGHIDLSTAIGRMAFRQLGAVARLESELRNERMRSKHRQLAVQGRPSGGHRSFGYALIPGQVWSWCPRRQRSSEKLLSGLSRVRR
jgi:site-specific DNA recombinase